jgi:tryptophanyl-tRNA synthetase
VRERFQAIRAEEAALERVLEEGAARAREITVSTLADVRQAMGVGPVRSAQ